MNRLADKVALITGSSRGIGAAIAKALADEHAKVVINYRSGKEGAEKVVQHIREHGGEAIAVQGDTSRSEDVRKLFIAAIEHFGKVDILVNNAGISIYKLIQDITDEDFERIFSINVKGVFNGMREAATRLADNGRIISLSSSVTRLMMPTYGPYSATKSAVEQLTRVFAKEVGKRGITVNSISPGPTDTPLFTANKSEEDIKRLAAMAALGRIGEPEDIAKGVVFLASDEAAWVTGQNLGLNGGFA
jgi:3-oxoacyl-[acyl-carrier protein] reductase